MGNGIVAQSEESITPNDTLPASSLRQQILPFASDDALPWVPLYRQAREQLKSRLCLSV